MTTFYWCLYIFISGLGSLFVRFINSIWRTFESNDPSFKKFKTIFGGFSAWTTFEEQRDEKEDKIKRVEKPGSKDYWQPFFIGWLELLAYPVLLVDGKVSFIGAWLAFKTVHRWSYAPGINRGFYNRYLISNALILIGSFLLAKFFVLKITTT